MADDTCPTCGSDDPKVQEYNHGSFSCIHPFHDRPAVPEHQPEENKMMSPQCMADAVDAGRGVVPDYEVCAFCGDPECGGIGCIANLDPDDSNDHPRIEELHDLIRAGRAWKLAAAVLADREGRS